MVMVIPADYPLMYQVVIIIYALGFLAVFVHLHLIPTKFSLNIRAVVVISYLKTLLQHQLNEDVDSDGHYDFHDAQSILVFSNSSAIRVAFVLDEPNAALNSDG